MPSIVANGLDEKPPHELVTASSEALSDGDNTSLVQSQTNDQLVGSPESLGAELEPEQDVVSDVGSDEDSEEVSDDDEEDEEDEEPALKYERLGGPIADLLQKDSASALVYSSQRFVRFSLFIHSKFSYCFSRH